jgi:hypothetical protein
MTSKRKDWNSKGRILHDIQYFEELFRMETYKEIKDSASTISEETYKIECFKEETFNAIKEYVKYELDVDTLGELKHYMFVIPRLGSAIRKEIEKDSAIMEKISGYARGPDNFSSLEFVLIRLTLMGYTAWIISEEIPQGKIAKNLSLDTYSLLKKWQLVLASPFADKITSEFLDKMVIKEMKYYSSWLDTCRYRSKNGIFNDSRHYKDRLLLGHFRAGASLRAAETIAILDTPIVGLDSKEFDFLFEVQ